MNNHPVAQDTNVDRLWREEALRRLAAYDAGQSKTFSMEEVMESDAETLRFHALLQTRLDQHRSGLTTGIPAIDVLGKL